ncbi:hypothetical protein IFM89_038167 [Coptis chinensis]|uniref:Uncharacterized protein n=1 Tax=Coptis chinensis TaxID=261450 RepID=A0A835HQF0_9MAGN|nr:hypothetical protein IFM89_038167 [Coptis chinensis]
MHNVSVLGSDSPKKGEAFSQSTKNASHDGSVKVASLSPSQNPPDVSLGKRGRPRNIK